MQGVHHGGEVTRDDLGKVIHRERDGVVDDLLVLGGRRLQHVADHGVLVTRVADPDAQPREVPAAELRDHVAQPVVTTVTAAALQPHRARRQIDLVVGDEDLLALEAIEIGDGRDRAPAVVHVGHGFQDAQALAAHLAVGHVAEEVRLGAEAPAPPGRDGVGEPEARVVTRARVARVRVA